uniref:Myb-like, SWIRM and MPN domain-containing protein 1 n=1 Tax=Xiphophorus couchianus TaxID=32473 RepID=A0A3B5LL07_9TELE
NMEDEVDVDIEGDDFDMIRCCLQPWELDSSISPENREAIERMLLEEQYPVTTADRLRRRMRCKGCSSPYSVLQTFSILSPTKSSTSASASSRWSKQEKELFEEGLAQYGRRWTKIAKLVDTRSVLQVKSYARQYFKHKVTLPDCFHTQQLRPPRPTMTNAVRIERLSDDEDVDITDDLSEGEGEDIKTELSGPKDRKTTSDENVVKTEPPETEAETESKLTINPSDDQSCQSHTLAHDGELIEECHDSTDSVENPDIQGPDGDPEEQDEEDEEVEELKAPEQEVELDTETITEDEKQAIPEFFEGRPSKTPERYLKIRNYILDQWCKPRYLNKTSVRPGLKNCGDVNCIGRIHTYLELIGAINFNCEQAVYNRPKVVDRTKPKEGKDVLEAYQLAQRLQSMRTRKRRVRDIWGNWCDARDLEGQTYEHLSAEELAQRREEMKKQPKPGKTSRYRGSFDPFQLIPCRSFERDVQEPFQVIVCAETLLIMDMVLYKHIAHARCVILLSNAIKRRESSQAEPCNSVSTGLQCEMDPVSQTQACDVLSSLGFSVVGWYHSHPSFHPNPSVRDINTQDQFQSYFSRGGAPFIGMIVSPYDPANPSTHSQITCLLVKESQEPSSQNKLPYRFNFLSSQDSPDWEQTMRRAQWIVQKYAQAHGSVQMDRLFRRDSSFTCLEKVNLTLCLFQLDTLSNGEGDQFLSEIQSRFLSDFVSKQKSSYKEEEEHLNISTKLLFFLPHES